MNNNKIEQYGLPKVTTANGDYVVTVLQEDMVTFSRVDVAFSEVKFNNWDDHAKAFAQIQEMTNPETFYSSFNGKLNVTFRR